MKLNRDEFLETGYLIVKEAVPRDKLERVRQAYETLVDRQRENWKAERAENDPPGGVWETAPQPRLQLSRQPLVNQIDQETAPAVEVWLEENIHGVSTELLDVADGAVTEMMMMCNPVRNHGPAKWRIAITIQSTQHRSRAISTISSKEARATSSGTSRSTTTVSSG